jgi:hypothetical protein
MEPQSPGRAPVAVADHGTRPAERAGHVGPGGTGVGSGSTGPRLAGLGSKLARAWTQPAWLAPLAVLACAGSAVGYVLANDPTDARPDALGPCLFRSLTGLDCPGCGGTRMVWYLLHGNLPEAARHHVVALLLVPLALYGYLAWGASRLFGTKIPWVPGKVFWLTVAAVVVVFSVLRNLPFEPFLHFRV